MIFAPGIQPDGCQNIIYMIFPPSLPPSLFLSSLPLPVYSIMADPVVAAARVCVFVKQ